MKLLPVKPFQETLHGSFCGPAVVKMVLDYYGIEKSGAELAALSHKDEILGVNVKDIESVLQSFGLKVNIINNASYDDLQAAFDQGYPTIVDWFTSGRRDYYEDSVPDGHYSVVVGLDETHIYLQDPEVGRVRKILKDDFYRVWFDFSSDHISSWDDLIVRQAIVVSKA